MANKRHLSILNLGVQKWNKWRKANPNLQPNLSKAKLICAELNDIDFQRTDLKGADLSKADLVGANFSHAILTGTRLFRSNLARANFANADLTDASLIGTNLGLTDFREANLTRANLLASNLLLADLTASNLTEASLGRTTFLNVRLKGANITKARLIQTVFSGCDLSTVDGLDNVIHIGPSSVDLTTIYQSGGIISEAFLRGVGLPDTFIVYARSLVGLAIEFYSCFISYSSKDHTFAVRLYADLQQKNIRCWFAPEDLKIGDRIRIEIDESIRKYDKLLLVLSKHSVDSQWVEKEVETALEQERKQKRTILFPIRLDDSVMRIESGWPADIKKTRHIGDFRKWKQHDDYQKAFDRLTLDLKTNDVKSPRA